MSRKKKPKWAFGFDPGINHCAWALVSDTGKVHAGLIKNTYKGSSKTPWIKLQCMIREVQTHIFTEGPAKLPRASIWVVEGQYTARGRGSPDIQIRNGWVAACAYCKSFGVCPAVVALPQVWTKQLPKEKRQELISEKVSPVEKWKWHSPVPPPYIFHNVWDAVGLACWGMENYL